MDQGPASGARYVFLDYLRAAAAWMVVWDHLANIMPGWAHRTFAPAKWVHDNIAARLGIVQDFGWLGVAVFFLISGFIISDRASVEGFGEFVTKRVLRIYPMLAVAVLLSAAFVVPRDQITPVGVVLNISLANYVFAPKIILLGVAWTLAIEIIFYALTAATQFARGSPHRVAITLIFVVLVLWRRGAFGPAFTWFAVSVAYLPILAMGQAIYWWLARRRLSALWGVGYLAASFGVFLWGVRLMQPAYLPLSNSYAVSVAYALVLFVALMKIPLRERRVVRLLSDTSYSLYLLHGIAGFLVLRALIDRLPLGLAIGLATGASLASAWLAFRIVERPVQGLARRIAWRRAPAISGAPVPRK